MDTRHKVPADMGDVNAGFVAGGTAITVADCLATEFQPDVRCIVSVVYISLSHTGRVPSNISKHVDSRVTQTAGCAAPVLTLGPALRPHVCLWVPAGEVGASALDSFAQLTGRLHCVPCLQPILGAGHHSITPSQSDS